MIVLMSLSVFAMDVSALNDRVGTGIEAALTATGAWGDGGVTGCSARDGCGMCYRV